MPALARSTRLTRRLARLPDAPPRAAVAERPDPERERRIAAREAALDAALEMSFPASDPLPWT